MILKGALRGNIFSFVIVTIWYLLIKYNVLKIGDHNQPLFFKKLDDDDATK